MQTQLIRLIAAKAIVSMLSYPALAQTAIAVPPVPANLEVPSGHVPYLKAYASGTQNYVCLPGANGPAWAFLGPQATLFVTLGWLSGEARHLQIATHFLSENPAEPGTARPAWQGSFDTSRVWGRAAASSSDPDYVQAGAIPWLLVAAAGTQRGAAGGTTLSETTYIHRVNTSGGVAPGSGCDAAVYGKVALVPYTADYVFYRRVRR